jgi:hypothetical protein
VSIHDNKQLFERFTFMASTMYMLSSKMYMSSLTAWTPYA